MREGCASGAFDIPAGSIARPSPTRTHVPTVRPDAEIVYDAATRRRVATFTGTLTDEELFGAYGALLEMPDYDYGADDLVDFRTVTRMDVTSEGLRRLMALFAEADELGNRARLAIIAPRDVTYGVARMYQLMRGDDVPEEIAVFRDYDEGVRWLDRKDAP